MNAEQCICGSNLKENYCLNCGAEVKPVSALALEKKYESSNLPERPMSDLRGLCFEIFREAEEAYQKDLANSEDRTLEQLVLRIVEFMGRPLPGAAVEYLFIIFWLIFWILIAMFVVKYDIDLLKPDPYGDNNNTQSYNHNQYFYVDISFSIVFTGIAGTVYLFACLFAHDGVKLAIIRISHMFTYAVTVPAIVLAGLTSDPTIMRLSGWTQFVIIAFICACAFIANIIYKLAINIRKSRAKVDKGEQA